MGMATGKSDDSTVGSMPLADPWLTISQVAAILRAKRAVVKKLHASGRLCGVKHGKVLVFHKDDVERFMKGKTW